MDFMGMFLELAKTPAFAEKVNERFAKYAAEKQIPAGAKENHLMTWNTATQAGAEVLAEIIGETMEKHPFLAKQAMKMLEV